MMNMTTKKLGQMLETDFFLDSISPLAVLFQDRLGNHSVYLISNSANGLVPVGLSGKG